jgi:hypothetical protein
MKQKVVSLRVKMDETLPNSFHEARINLISKVYNDTT